MYRFPVITKYFFWSIFLISSLTSCSNTRKVAYFADVKDSTLIASKESLEPVIQKKDILSIAVSSLSSEANIVFNTPNQPASPIASTTNSSQTAGYLVG